MLLKLSKMLIARFAPSNGSVPEPNSSTKTKEFSVAFFVISIIFNMCEEKVLKESEML